MMDFNLLVKLVALNERTRQAWAHPHNKSFYKAASFQGDSVCDGKSRETTPGDREMNKNNYKQDTEPELQLYLDNRPKNMSKGWVFGSDRTECDIYCGEPSKSKNYNIGRQTFSITLNEELHVILKHFRDTNGTQVQYGPQKAGYRQAFVWIMFDSCKEIVVTSAWQLNFKVVVTKTAQQPRMCRTLHLQCRSQFLKDAKASMPSKPQISVNSGSISSLASAMMTQPFYYVRKDQRLGSGSFGEVFIVMDASTGVPYAGKTFFNEVDRNEAEILAEQNHVNILRYVNMSIDDGPLLVTEYVKEGNLARPWEIGDKDPWQVHQIVSILIQALRGLARLHARPNPVIHRDIKPENILVADYDRGSDPNEYGPWIKLADFGLATQGSKCEGQAGTWRYSAPEVFDTRVRYSSKVDIWSLGVVILQLLLGGNLPVPSGPYMEGKEWCEDIFYFTQTNANASVEIDREELSENEYSLESFLWAFLKNFMLQANDPDRLSAQECLNERLCLEMQSAVRLERGWRIKEPTFNAEGEFVYTKFNITKKFAPKARAPLPNICDGAVTKAIYDPGMEVGAALRALSERDKTARASKAAQPERPKPIGFGLVFGDPSEDIRYRAY